MRVATWNVGTMTGKSGEIVETLRRRKIHICCVQETRWKGAGARMIGDKGQAYKFMWQGEKEGFGGVGILVAEEQAMNIIEVKRLSARVIVLRMMVEKATLRVVSVYAPQVGRPDSEKEEFWSTVEIATSGLGKEEHLVVAGDFNGHVGENE